MSEIARISAVVTANTSQFTKSMKAADATIKGTSANMARMDGAAAASASSMDRLGKSSRTAAVGIKAAKLGLAALAVTAFVGFKEMQSQEKVSAMTANTLKNVGNSAGFTVKKIEAMSSALALQTGTADEVIQSSANILLGFKDIGNNADIFKKVLAGSMDRAAKTGRDLVTTTRAIGFAYQSPISGVGMLRRAGILLDKDTQKHIKTLQEEGHLEQARALLLDKVTGSAKGAAKALGQTSTGQVARLNEAFKQMSENVAKAVLPALLAIGPPLITMFKSLTPLFKSVGEAIKSIANAFTPMIQSVLSNAVAIKALTVAAVAFIGIGLAGKVIAMGSAFTRAATGASAFGKATTVASSGGVLSGLVSMVAGVGKIGAAYGGAALGVGKFAQTDPFAKHVQGMGRFSKASGFAKGQLGALAGAIPLVSNPLGLLVAGVGVGIASLFLFANRTDYATRQMQTLANASNTATTAIQATTSAVQAESNALVALSSSNANVAQKNAAAKAAQEALTQATLNGARAGETAAQYQARINALRQKAVSTASAASAAESSNAQQIKSTVSNLDVLTGAYAKNKSALQTQAATAKQMGASVFATQKTRNQAALDLLSTEGALSKLDKQRPAELKNIIAQTKVATAAVKSSSLTDLEKTAQLEKIKGVAAKAQQELNKISSTKAKAKVEPPDKTAEERLKEIRRQFGLLPNSKTINITTNYKTNGKPPGGFRGGYVAGYAGGGVVRGPSGKDVIPAMLTAGEVVLTKKQQSLVDNGMSVREAIMKTGGAFAKGGAVGQGYGKGYKKPAYNASKETKSEYNARVKQERADYAKNKKEEKLGKVKEARSAFTSALKTNLGRNITEKYQGGMTGIGSIETTRRAQEASNKQFEKDWAGTTVSIGQGIGSFMGNLKDFDKMQTVSNRNWERSWTGTITKIDGSTFTGGFKDFDKAVEAGRKAIEDQYSALTTSEAALKSLNDEAAAADLSSNIADAQKAYELAKQFGNAKEIADAQKALGKAELDQRRADLEGKAKTEREAADAAKAVALTQYEEKAAQDRQALQDSFDDQKALRDAALQEARDSLQASLDAELQKRRDNDSMVLAQAAWAQEQEQIILDQQIANLEAHWGSVQNLTSSQATQAVNLLTGFGNQFALSGTTLIGDLAAGIKAGGPQLKAAVVSIGNLIKKYLKLNSPADKGPLSTIDHWFDALGPTLASGMDMSAVEKNLNGLATPTAGGARGGSGSGVTINLTVTDSTFSGMSRDQADRVARDIQAAIARQISLGV